MSKIKEKADKKIEVKKVDKKVSTFKKKKKVKKNITSGIVRFLLLIIQLFRLQIRMEM